MNFQPASRSAIRHVAAGTLLTALALSLFSGLDSRVLLGAAGGCIVAILNFTLMCLTIQKAVEIHDHKARRAFIQGSYHGRLLMQALWVIAAFRVPQISPAAAAAPLFLPGMIVFFRRNLNKKLQ